MKIIFNHNRYDTPKNVCLSDVVECLKEKFVIIEAREWNLNKNEWYIIIMCKKDKNVSRGT